MISATFAEGASLGIWVPVPYRRTLARRRQVPADKILIARFIAWSDAHMIEIVADGSKSGRRSEPVPAVAGAWD